MVANKANKMRHWVLLVVIVTACDNSPTQVTTGKAANLGQRVWPFLADQENTSAIAEDLLRKNIYVVFDGSGSMASGGCSGSSSKDVAAKRALSRFASTVPVDAAMGLLVFDRRGVSERVALQPRNRRRFVDQVSGVTPGGSTPLQTSVAMAYKKLTAKAQSQLGYGEYHLVVVTDGEASAGEDPTHIVNTIIDHSPVIIHTIGFCIGSEHSLNQAGRVLYKQANDSQSLEQGLESVLAEAPDYSVGEFN